MSKPLEGQVALVTGAAGVLCSVFVKHLLQSGAKVVLMGRTEAKLEALKEKCANDGLNKTLVCQADVTSRKDLVAARIKIHETWGKVNLLINGAGGNQPGAVSAYETLTPGADLSASFFGMDADAYRSVMDLNLIGTLLPCQVFGADMIESGEGNIINISSLSAILPLTKVAGYSNAKAAIDSFTKWLSVHLAPSAIRVNAIAPGFFATEQNKFLLFEKDGKTLTERGNKIVSQTPFGRFGKHEELLTSLTFLADPASTFVTGTVIVVDGGFSAYSGV